VKGFDKKSSLVIGKEGRRPEETKLRSSGKAEEIFDSDRENAMREYESEINALRLLDGMQVVCTGLSVMLDAVRTMNGSADPDDEVEEKGMEKAGLKASREILKKAAQKAEKRKPEVSEITLADLTKAITAKIDEKEENSERIREILNEDFHTEKVRELPKESYSAFLKAVEAL